MVMKFYPNGGNVIQIFNSKNSLRVAKLHLRQAHIYAKVNKLHHRLKSSLPTGTL